MKKIIILCTIAICSTICGAGYFIACTCGNGAYSMPSYYLDFPNYIFLILFAIIAIGSLFFAFKDLRNKP